VTTQLRLLVGGTALVAGLGYLAGAFAAPPALSKDTYKKVAEADIAQLQKTLATCESDASSAKRYGPTAKSLAMMLALYGEASGDKALKDQALKVADAVGAKKFDAASAAAKSLAVKPGTKSLEPGNLAKLGKYNLDEVMSPFRGGTVGGLNIEKDIRSLRDAKMPVVPADVEVLAARAAILLDYATIMPNDKATVNKANTAEWEKLSKDSIEIAKKISDEAAKGKGANEKEIVKLIKSLDAKCVVCHNKFRDD
jgi:hypothetical protein